MEPGNLRHSLIGPPQGGIVSPLLANIYLHELDQSMERFTDLPLRGRFKRRRQGKGNFLYVRYADDFVVLARYISPQLRGWIEGKLEEWLGLQINREKTRVLDLQEAGQSLDFLGYTFRYDRDQYGRGNRRYLNLQPSRKAMAREREALRQLINRHQSHTPLPELIGRVNRNLRGWSHYFKLGYPRRAFRALNHFVRYRLGKHLQRRSQRGWRARKGVSLYAHLEHLGLRAL